MPRRNAPYPLNFFRQQMIEPVHAGRTPEELSRGFEPSAQAIRRANERVGGKPRAMRDIVKAFRRPPIRPLPVRPRDRNGGFPRLSDVP